MTDGNRLTGVIPQINGANVLNGDGLIIPWSDYVPHYRRFLTYTVAIPLNAGDVYNFVAGANDGISYQEFSAAYKGHTTIGFIVAYTGRRHHLPLPT